MGLGAAQSFSRFWPGLRIPEKKWMLWKGGGRSGYVFLGYLKSTLRESEVILWKLKEPLANGSLKMRGLKESRDQKDFGMSEKTLKGPKKYSAEVLKGRRARTKWRLRIAGGAERYSGVPRDLNLGKTFCEYLKRPLWVTSRFPGDVKGPWETRNYLGDIWNSPEPKSYFEVSRSSRSPKGTDPPPKKKGLKRPCWPLGNL